jgi:predicted dehydrogenase
MSREIKWGIIGPGRIASAFARALNFLPGARLVAVASTSRERAEAFGENFNIERRYDRYEKLMFDKDIDAVYIAVPHSLHHELAMKCLNSGKAVLCEKPIGINADQMKELSECAERNGVFLMEAMWTRFLPIIKEIKAWIENGLIGEVRLVKANFGFRGDGNPQGRLLNAKLASGALMDIGIYPITLADIIYEESPQTVTSAVNMSNTGVDEESTVIMKYDKGRMAEMSISIKNYIPHEGIIVGTKGEIKIPSFFMAESAVVEIDGEEPRELCIPFMCNGYEYEAVEVMNCLREGKGESLIMPHKVSIRILEIMDRIRNQWGLKYPEEQEYKEEIPGDISGRGL